MIVSIYLLYTVLSFIRTVFLHVLNMLLGSMTTRLNKCYCYCYCCCCYYYYYYYYDCGSYIAVPTGTTATFLVLACCRCAVVKQ